MSKFASVHGIGIACDTCRDRVIGRHASYADLLADHPGWTLSACPPCSDARGRFTREPAAGLPPHLVLGTPRPRRLR